MYFLLLAACGPAQPTDTHVADSPTDTDSAGQGDTDTGVDTDAGVEPDARALFTTSDFYTSNLYSIELPGGAPEGPLVNVPERNDVIVDGADVLLISPYAVSRYTIGDWSAPTVTVYPEAATSVSAAVCGGRLFVLSDLRLVGYEADGTVAIDQTFSGDWQGGSLAAGGDTLFVAYKGPWGPVTAGVVFRVSCASGDVESEITAPPGVVAHPNATQPDAPWLSVGDYDDGGALYQLDDTMVVGPLLETEWDIDSVASAPDGGVVLGLHWYPGVGTLTYSRVRCVDSSWDWVETAELQEYSPLAVQIDDGGVAWRMVIGEPTAVYGFDAATCTEVAYVEADVRTYVASYDLY